MTHTDITFFTNEPDQNLLDRFKATLKFVRFFDVLVGYFRTSGFHLLQDALEPIEKTRILVGLNADRQAYELISGCRQESLNFHAHDKIQENSAAEFIKEMENAPDTYDTEIGVFKFISMLQSGRLEIKAHPSQNIHAKIYISRFHQERHSDFGKVITGSSNFSQAGLLQQYEFNVELKNSADVRYALKKFEALWAEAVDISEIYVDTVRQRTWLNDKITPYELYLKFLYEYFNLHRICWGKKVILISATPYNNTISDIFSQIKLFQAAKKSWIPNLPNLEKFFKQCEKHLKEHEKGTPEYIQAVQAISKSIRDRVLKYVMVRRTRNEIKNYFQEDIKQQGLFFPELAQPRRIIYEFDKQSEAVFNETVNLLRRIHYARYTPLLYLKKPLDQLEIQSQYNIRSFMKSLLVKRLESSFFAFQQSIQRFIVSHEKFIDMHHRGAVYISKKINVYELLENDDEERLLQLVESEQVEKYAADEFTEKFIEELEEDLHTLCRIEQHWQPIWAEMRNTPEADPKLCKFIDDLENHPELKGQKLIIFTESAETGQYLYQALEQYFSGEALFYASSGGYYKQSPLSPKSAQEIIRQNYDPACPGSEDTIRSELEFLQEIRKVRDEQPELYEKIKRLPKKARSCHPFEHGETAAQLLSFFRLGRLKKFFLASAVQAARELDFFTAADTLRCTPKTPRGLSIPADYYDFIQYNKDAFGYSIAPERHETASAPGSRSNEAQILKRLKDRTFKKHKGFTDDDENYILQVRTALEAGVLPKNTNKRIKQALDKILDPLQVLRVLRDNIPNSLLYDNTDDTTDKTAPGEIILSAYLPLSN
ncbi:MAG: hypothetical protein GY862_36470 [Gammaproteobacteria bacterium]|nr:hypothetical protein [Gammaproteobacteria bacterium]